MGIYAAAVAVGGGAAAVGGLKLGGNICCHKQISLNCNPASLTSAF